ncbi:MntP/YtaF family protein [Natronospora cellulosivora (SeqCode)]
MLDFFIMFFYSFLFSIDDGIMAFSLGIKRIPFDFLSILAISLIATFVMLISMFIGRFSGAILPTTIIEYLAGILLILIGLSQSLPSPPLYGRNRIKVIAIIVNINVIAFGLQAGLEGYHFLCSITVPITLIISLSTGLLLGYHMYRKPFFSKYSSYLPTIIFLVLGFKRFL